MGPVRSLFLIGLLVPPVSRPDITVDQALRQQRHQAVQVKIGLLIPDPGAVAARHGAELAIREANAATGSLTYQLVVRSTEGPWGAGSKESVGLVFEDEVAVIMGSLDSRNAHLAEQVATKTRIAMLSSWATEMSLSEAFVPWYYRCIPNDHQQATALAREIYGNRKYNKVATIASEKHDAQLAANAFVKVAASFQHEVPRQYTRGPSGNNLAEILAAIEKLGMEAIVLFGDPEFAADLVPMLKQRGMNQRIFGTLALTDGQKAINPDWNNLEGIILVSTDHWFTEEGIAFQQAFRKTFGYQPGAAAVYAYDGIRVIIDVIRRGGPDRDGIIEAFDDTDYPSGITGSIRFDARGNRSGRVDLMTVRNGKPSKLTTD